MWVIRGKTVDRHKRPLYWSNNVGWTYRDFADVFSDAEHESVLLPIDGVWEEVVS